MKPGPHEPENYSIDDMMDRLKNNPPTKNEDASELVTREDGSQVLRVRKRKRRSKQPQRDREKVEQKRRFARLLIALVLSIAVLGAYAGCIIYANSGSYRERLVAKIASATGAKVELTQFRMNPAGANANSLNLVWPDGHPIASLHSRNLRTDTSISALFGGTFRGEELNAGESTLTWRPAKPSAAVAGLADGSVGFHRISVSRFHLLPDDSQRHMFRLRNAEASFYPNTDTGGHPQLRLNGGNLQLRGLPDLNLDRAFLEYRGDEINLSVARLLHGTDHIGELLLAGTIPALDPSATATLSIDATSFVIEGIIGEPMGRIILGRVDSSRIDGASTLRFPISDPSAGTMELDFKSSLNSLVQIKGFNFLSELAMLLEEPWFEQPYFDGNVTGVIRRSRGTVEIRNLNAEHRNRLALRGNLRLESNGRLNGTIDIGLSPALVATAPTRRLDPVISESSGGYRWISVSIGGTINAPTDNFMVLLDTPPQRAEEPSGRDGASFEDLTRPR